MQPKRYSRCSPDDRTSSLNDGRDLVQFPVPPEHLFNSDPTPNKLSPTPTQLGGTIPQLSPTPTLLFTLKTASPTPRSARNPASPSTSRIPPSPPTRGAQPSVGRPRNAIRCHLVILPPSTTPKGAHGYEAPKSLPRLPDLRRRRRN